jgi:hypothetical protein
LLRELYFRFILITLACILIKVNTFFEDKYDALQADETLETDSNTTDTPSDEESQDETMHCAQVLKFKFPFWCLFFIIICFYGSTVPFFHICVDFFEQKWGLDSQTAAIIFSVPDWISVI